MELGQQVQVAARYAEPSAVEETAPCPVNSYNEWDPLEEIVVGRLEGATIPSNHISVTFDVPQKLARLYRFVGGRRYPKLLIEPEQRELDAFIRILEAEGVTVRRPDVVDFSRPFSTPDWRSKGFCTSCPRDGLLVIGNEIIETPMAWRSRYFENYAYRSLFKEYFARGARWTAAPRPQLLDSLYDRNFRLPRKGEALRYVINESEPVFDAADFVRCGRDLFVTQSNVTNAAGITWLQLRAARPGQGAHQPGLHRPGAAAAHFHVVGRPGRAASRPASQMVVAHAHVDVQQLDQHQRAESRRAARDRRAESGVDDQGARDLGVRADSVPVSQLRPLRRGVSLRDARHSSPRNAPVLLLAARWNCPSPEYRVIPAEAGIQSFRQVPGPPLSRG
jgi:hypothetical protein